MVKINKYLKTVSFNVRKAWEARIPKGIVCRPYKFIYFPVPKAACTSLKQVIADLCGLEQKFDPNFIDFEWVSGQRLNEFPDYFRFTVVRNPWDRLASCYGNKIKSANNPFPSTFDRYNQVLQVKIFYPEMPFDQFVKRVVLIPDVLSDEHFRSQKRLVCDPKGRLLVHKVAKLENLNEDLTDIFKTLQLPSMKMPHLNQTSSSRYKDYYNDELWDLVTRRYRSDIEMFGYRW